MGGLPSSEYSRAIKKRPQQADRASARTEPLTLYYAFRGRASPNSPPLQTAVLNMASWYNGGGSIEEEEREWESN